jgi:hypothetical protein
LSASWCGKKVVPEKIRQRPGWDAIPAVRNNRLVEIKSPLILQPGPAALTRTRRNLYGARRVKMTAMISSESVIGIVLAGGKSSRMGGNDKIASTAR